MDCHATASQRLESERKSLQTRIHFFVLLLVRGISKMDSRCFVWIATPLLRSGSR